MSAARFPSGSVDGDDQRLRGQACDEAQDHAGDGGVVERYFPEEILEPVVLGLGLGGSGQSFGDVVEAYGAGLDGGDDDGGEAFGACLVELEAAFEGLGDVAEGLGEQGGILRVFRLGLTPVMFLFTPSRSMGCNANREF